MPLITHSVSSDNGDINADLVDGAIILVSVEGPLTPGQTTRALKTVAPILQHLYDSEMPYGAILKLEKDATIFHEAMTLFLNATTDFHLRRALAFVIDPQIIGSMIAAIWLREFYKDKMYAPFQVFPSEAAAIDWVKSVLRGEKKEQENNLTQTDDHYIKIID